MKLVKTILDRIKVKFTKIKIEKIDSEQVQITDYNESYRYQVLKLIEQDDFEVGTDLPLIGLVALFKGTVIGYIGASPTYGRNVLVTIVVVHPVARKMKIGLGLMKAMAYELKKRGYARFEAWVDEENINAIVIYAKMGIELRKGYILEGILDNIIENINK